MKSITNHLGHILVSIAAIALCISVVVFSAPGITGFFGDMTGSFLEKGDAMLNKVSVPHAQGTPKLESPVVTLEGSVLTIAPVANATSYAVYSGSTLLTETTETTVDLATYITEVGTYTIKVQAYAEGYKNSSYGTVEYVIEPNYVNFTVTSSNRAKVGYTGAENEELVIPATFKDGDTWYKVTQIGYEAFSNCTSLTSISIPDSVTTIGTGAFFGCTALTSVTIPDCVTSIAMRAFYNCTNLTSIGPVGSGASVEIPDSVTSIDSNAFQFCQGLTSITIPDSVTIICQGAFKDCTRLTSITFEGTVDQWDAISKGDFWNNKVPATEVVCTDGSVAL